MLGTLSLKGLDKWLIFLSVRCRRRPHRGTPKPPPFKKSPKKPSSSSSSRPPSTLDALNDDADTAFDLPTFQDFAGLKGSAFRESIKSLEEMADREPYQPYHEYHESSFELGPSVHPSDTVFANEPRENGRQRSFLRATVRVMQPKTRFKSEDYVLSAAYLDLRGCVNPAPPGCLWLLERVSRNLLDRNLQLAVYIHEIMVAIVPLTSPCTRSTSRKCVLPGSDS